MTQGRLSKGDEGVDCTKGKAYQLTKDITIPKRINLRNKEMPKARRSFHVGASLRLTGSLRN